MPTVTRLRDDGRGRVAVELDDAPWRTLPVDVVARSGLVEGRALDRGALRLLRQELRRDEEVERRVRSKIVSQKRAIPEGSQEWDILYRKYYNEEVKKLGI